MEAPVAEQFQAVGTILQRTVPPACDVIMTTLLWCSVKEGEDLTQSVSNALCFKPEVLVPWKASTGSTVEYVTKI